LPTFSATFVPKTVAIELRMQKLQQVVEVGRFFETQCTLTSEEERAS